MVGVEDGWNGVWWVSLLSHQGNDHWDPYDTGVEERSDDYKIACSPHGFRTPWFKSEGL